MEEFRVQENKEIFERRLLQLRRLWETLRDKKFDIAGKMMEMDMMPFEMIEEDLRRDIPIPMVNSFGGSGLRVSFDRKDGIKIWFTNSFGESKDFQEAKKEIQSLWEDIKNES